MSAHRITVKPKTGGRTLSYVIDALVSKRELETIAIELANPVSEVYAIDRILAPKTFAYAVEVGFLPGVTDNVGMTVREMVEDALGKKLEGMVYSSYFLFSSTKPDVGSLYNPLIERASVIARAAWRPKTAPVVPRVNLSGATKADLVDLDVSDEELTTIGKRGIKSRGPLALTLDDMRNIRDYFAKLKRPPTDIELESIAQTWSEHCKHTIFSDPLDDITEGVYRRYIKGATMRIRKEKGTKDFCVSVFKDNSGAIVFDDEYLVTHKVETHNSPSALDPFGGAITGIGGVNRDALGFGLGAKPIANTYGYCVGEPSDTRRFYRDQARTQPLLSSRRILEGVVKGVNAGGNQSGIPTPLGFVATDPRFRGKPLVFVGTVGLIPRKVKGRKMWEKQAKPGDLVVMLGGRVGLDGVHGATFSSEALATGSPATAVQIGDPITQKKMSDAIIREARDKNLYSSITDNGAGGLSCSVAEMARESGGCEVNLDKVPLKYPGLAPWQIWISESQERMTLAVSRGKWKVLKRIMDKHGVEASVIGNFTKLGRCVVRAGGKKVMDISLDFLHDGRIPRQQKSRPPGIVSYPAPPHTEDPAKKLLALLASPSIGGHAFISDQYDHEVQGTSVTKPLQGCGRVNADSAVLKPVPSSKKGIMISHGYAPWHDTDAYAMAAMSIDMAVRNAVAAGATLDHLAILDNFCWSSGNSPERLYQLKEAARACYDVAVAYGTPFISGKDSMFNDFKGFDDKGAPVHIAVPPTLLISTLGVIPNVARATTLDFKRAGDPIYLLGEKWTSDVHFELRKSKKLYASLARAIGAGLVASATPVTFGGSEVALAKAAIAGQLGARVKSGEGVIVVSIAPKNAKKFEKAMRGNICKKIGHVTQEKRCIIYDTHRKPLISLPLSRLTAAYRKPFKGF
jgi:phosphoribosylformylglycinamidine synthase